MTSTKIETDLSSHAKQTFRYELPSLEAKVYQLEADQPISRRSSLLSEFHFPTDNVDLFPPIRQSNTRPIRSEIHLPTASPDALLVPKYNNLSLQKYVDALYSDPVVLLTYILLPEVREKFCIDIDTY